MAAVNSTFQLGDLQLAIMRVLWARGEATVAEVHAALEPERGLVFTTIATMLTKMEDKGVVAHRSEGRRFIYRPTVSESEVQRAMLADLTQRLFLGDVTAVVSQLLDTTQVDAEELAQLRSLIARHQQIDPNEEA